MSKLKLCPVCGGGAVRNSELSYRPTASCDNPECWLYGLGFHLHNWNDLRPIEDALRAEIAAKDAEIERLREYSGQVANIRAELSREVEAQIILNARKPLEAEIERMRGIIRKAEFGINSFLHECPICHFIYHDKPDGHTEHCPLYQWEGGAQC